MVCHVNVKNTSPMVKLQMCFFIGYFCLLITIARAIAKANAMIVTDTMPVKRIYIIRSMLFSIIRITSSYVGGKLHLFLFSFPIKLLYLIVGKIAIYFYVKVFDKILQIERLVNMQEDLFIPEEDKLEIDLHDMQVLEAEYYLDKFVSTAPANIKEIIVIHGYKKGQAILNMVRNSFKHERVKEKVIPFNKGITLLFLK